MKRIINSLYHSTRGARILNFVISTVWVAAALFYIMDFPIFMPIDIKGSAGIILVLASSTSLMSLISLFKVPFNKTYKCISLHTGALLQSIVSMGYTNGYPPLEIHAIISFILALWLIGAAYFEMDEESRPKKIKKEQYNANDLSGY